MNREDALELLGLDQGASYHDIVTSFLANVKPLYPESGKLQPLGYRNFWRVCSAFHFLMAMHQDRSSQEFITQLGNIANDWPDAHSAMVFKAEKFCQSILNRFFEFDPDTNAYQERLSPDQLYNVTNCHCMLCLTDDEASVYHARSSSWSNPNSTWNRHSDSSFRRSGPPMCRHYLAGKCSFDLACKFSHDVSVASNASSTAPPSSSSPASRASAPLDRNSSANSGWRSQLSSHSSSASSSSDAASAFRSAVSSGSWNDEDDEDDDEFFRSRPPPPNYLCRLCQEPGHWFNKCRLFVPHDPNQPRNMTNERPPEAYVCRLCNARGHWIFDCKNFVRPVSTEAPSSSSKSSSGFSKSTSASAHASTAAASSSSSSHAPIASAAPAASPPQMSASEKINAAFAEREKAKALASQKRADRFEAELDAVHYSLWNSSESEREQKFLSLLELTNISTTILSLDEVAELVVSGDRKKQSSSSSTDDSSFNSEFTVIANEKKIRTVLSQHFPEAVASAEEMLIGSPSVKKETSKKLVELASKLMSIVSNVYLIFGKSSHQPFIHRRPQWFAQQPQSVQASMSPSPTPVVAPSSSSSSSSLSSSLSSSSPASATDSMAPVAKTASSTSSSSSASSSSTIAVKSRVAPAASTSLAAMLASIQPKSAESAVSSHSHKKIASSNSLEATEKVKKSNNSAFEKVSSASSSSATAAPSSANAAATAVAVASAVAAVAAAATSAGATNTANIDLSAVQASILPGLTELLAAQEALKARRDAIEAKITELRLASGINLGGSTAASSAPVAAPVTATPQISAPTASNPAPSESSQQSQQTLQHSASAIVSSYVHADPSSSAAYPSAYPFHTAAPNANGTPVAGTPGPVNGVPPAGYPYGSPYNYNYGYTVVYAPPNYGYMPTQGMVAGTEGYGYAGYDPHQYMPMEGVPQIDPASGQPTGAYIDYSGYHMMDPAMAMNAAALDLSRQSLSPTAPPFVPSYQQHHHQYDSAAPVSSSSSSVPPLATKRASSVDRKQKSHMSPSSSSNSFDSTFLANLRSESPLSMTSTSNLSSLSDNNPSPNGGHSSTGSTSTTSSSTLNNYRSLTSASTSGSPSASSPPSSSSSSSGNMNPNAAIHSMRFLKRMQEQHQQDLLRLRQQQLDLVHQLNAHQESLPEDNSPLMDVHNMKTQILQQQVEFLSSQIQQVQTSMSITLQSSLFANSSGTGSSVSNNNNHHHNSNQQRMLTPSTPSSASTVSIPSSSPTSTSSAPITPHPSAVSTNDIAVIKSVQLHDITLAPINHTVSESTIPEANSSTLHVSLLSSSKSSTTAMSAEQVTGDQIEPFSQPLQSCSKAEEDQSLEQAA